MWECKGSFCHLVQTLFWVEGRKYWSRVAQMLTCEVQTVKENLNRETTFLFNHKIHILSYCYSPLAPSCFNYFLVHQTPSCTVVTIVDDYWKAVNVCVLGRGVNVWTSIKATSLVCIVLLLTLPLCTIQPTSVAAYTGKVCFFKYTLPVVFCKCWILSKYLTSPLIERNPCCN